MLQEKFDMRQIWNLDPKSGPGFYFNQFLGRGGGLNGSTLFKNYFHIEN